MDDESPVAFRTLFWNQPVGLVITAILTLLLVNTIPLENISIAGSINFLFIFSLVNFVRFRLAPGNGREKILPFCGVVLCLSALVTLIIRQFASDKLGIFISAGIILACFLYEFAYKRIYAGKHP